MKMWWFKLLNRLGFRKDPLICIRQVDAFLWPSNLGKQTPGLCCKCAAPIFFEDKNWFFKHKICHVCSYNDFLDVNENV